MPLELCMKRTLLSALCTGLLFGIAAASAGLVAHAAPLKSGPPSAVGLWEQADDDGRVNGWFQIYERDGVTEGKIVKIFPQSLHVALRGRFWIPPSNSAARLCLHPIVAEFNLGLVDIE